MTDTQKHELSELIQMCASCGPPPRQESGVATLHPSLVIAGLSFLDDDQCSRLDATLKGTVGATDYMERTTRFLLREVGAEKMMEQWERLKSTPGVMS